MKILLYTILIITFLGCKTNSKMMHSKTEIKSEFVPEFAAGPHVLVYKTKADYNNLVPIILSEDKTSIVSYPDPGDIKVSSVYTLPTPLHQGYVIDNRGIDKNAVFINKTYKDYSKFTELPSLKELFNLIIDKEPIIELCDCGLKSAFTNEVEQLNELIDNNQLRTKCKVIK
jgi:hypothetical protein